MPLKKKQCRQFIFFEKDDDKFTWIIIDSKTINNAKNLVKKHWQTGLRTLDAIQLACAISVKGRTNDFHTSDRTLNTIFIKEGLNTIN